MMNSFNRSVKKQQSLSEEQFSEVVTAILEGQYSWACVLILRFTGHNPLHFIPYRTYNRLTKDHCKQIENICTSNTNSKKASAFELQQPDDPLIQRSSKRISDLSYLENLTQKEAELRGGIQSYENNSDIFWLELLYSKL
jgi:hypothetical protein